MIIDGIKHVHGTYNGIAFDNVKFIFVSDTYTPDCKEFCIDKDGNQTFIGGMFHKFDEVKVKTADALTIFGVNTLDDLYRYVGKDVQPLFDARGNIVSLLGGVD